MGSLFPVRHGFYGRVTRGIEVIPLANKPGGRFSAALEEKGSAARAESKPVYPAECEKEQRRNTGSFVQDDDFKSKSGVLILNLPLTPEYCHGLVAGLSGL